jgi:regulatory protein
VESFACSERSLRRALARVVRRAAPPAEGEEHVAATWIDALVARFLRSGLLDDRRYAEARAHSLLRQGRSRRGIAAWLAARGVGGADISATLAGLEDEHEEPELAAAAAHARRRRLGPWRLRNSDPQRELGSLARRGFSFDVARRVVTATDPDDLPRG